MTNIRNFKVYGDIKYTNILLVGPLAAGKSAFINSISTIDKKRMAHPVVAGGSGGSVTKKLQVCKLKDQLKGQYRLQDTMGIEQSEDGGFYVDDIIPLMNGNLRPNFEFNSARPMETDVNYNENPTLEDQVHCIALVIEAKMLVETEQELPTTLIQKLLRLIELVRTKGVPMVMVLTKIDKCFPERPRSNISEIYKDARIKKAVDNASELFGVQKMDIFPVKNYCSEVDLNLHMDILLLLALQRMQHLASDHVEHVHDQMEHVQDQMEHAHDQMENFYDAQDQI